MQPTTMSQLIPIVIEKEGRGERAYDIYSRLLKMSDSIQPRGGFVPIPAGFGDPTEKCAIQPDWVGTRKI